MRRRRLAVGGNAELNLEVSMMLDITGSMGDGTKLADMKSAATDLVNIVVWADQSEYTSRIAIVPFAYDVRLPATALRRPRDVTFDDISVRRGAHRSAEVYRCRTAGRPVCDGA